MKCVCGYEYVEGVTYKNGDSGYKVIKGVQYYNWLKNLMESVEDVKQ